MATMPYLTLHLHSAALDVNADPAVSERKHHSWQIWMTMEYEVLRSTSLTAILTKSVPFISTLRRQSEVNSPNFGFPELDRVNSPDLGFSGPAKINFECFETAQLFSNAPSPANRSQTSKSYQHSEYVICFQLKTMSKRRFSSFN